MKKYEMLGKRNAKQKCEAGFTLIELMTVILIVAVIAVFAVPAFSSFTARKNAENTAFEVINSLKLARSQAMSTGRTIYICALNGSHSSGFTGCNAGNDWSNGWGIVIDGVAGENGVYRVYQPYGNVSVSARKVEIRPNGLQTDGSFDIVIHPNGMSDTSADKTVSIYDASMGYKLN